VGENETGSGKGGKDETSDVMIPIHGYDMDANFFSLIFLPTPVLTHPLFYLWTYYHYGRLCALVLSDSHVPYGCTA
jgi:hypothetical protein